ncbi:MAG: hypothetical protein M1396_06110 [Chloroflexi bacterium]|nr:hypothetical protein [Chloroflexota bacterium]
MAQTAARCPRQPFAMAAAQRLAIDRQHFVRPSLLIARIVFTLRLSHSPSAN